VRDRIVKLAGSSHGAEAPLRAEARITRQEDGKFHLDLVVHAGALVGTRHIEGSSCEDLSGAAAVALALLLRSSAPLSEGDLAGHDTGAPPSSGNDASGTSETGREDAKPSDQARPTPEVARPSAPSSNEARRARRLHALLEAPLGVFALGPLPEPSFGVAVAGGVSFERWRFLVEGTVWRTEHLTASDEPSIGADVHHFTAGLGACWAMLPGRLELSPCAVVTVEHLSARGTGEHIASRSANSTWLAAGIGVQARWRLVSWFGLFGGVSGQIEGSRPVIAIDGVGRLGQTWPASLTVMVGPEWIL
jgi:hypothetical protein